MAKTYLWRYMSLAKYIDLISSRKVCCPKASLFNDSSEGKWFAHVSLWNEKERWKKVNLYTQSLQNILNDAYGDKDKLIKLANNAFDKLNKEDKLSAFAIVLETIAKNKSVKLFDYVELTLENWRKRYDKHNSDVLKWKQQAIIKSDSTYISCWNQADVSSLAMWNLYGGGPESIAIRVEFESLEKVLSNNRINLEKNGFVGQIKKVEYVEGLNNPNKQLLFKLLDEINLHDDSRIGEFCIKPVFYSYENEVRIIIFQKLSPFDPVEDKNPELDFVFLDIEDGKMKLNDFISGVYTHPLSSSNQMIIDVITSLNKKYGLEDIPVINEDNSALGESLNVPIR